MAASHKAIIGFIGFDTHAIRAIGNRCFAFSNGNIVTQIDIANQSETDRMMVSKVLRTLQLKGLIARREHRTDTRAKEITLTRKALDLVQKAVVAVEQTDREFFGVLRTERESFNESMRQLIKRDAEHSIV